MKQLCKEYALNINQLQDLQFNRPLPVSTCLGTDEQEFIKCWQVSERVEFVILLFYIALSLFDFKSEAPANTSEIKHHDEVAVLQIN